MKYFWIILLSLIPLAAMPTPHQPSILPLTTCEIGAIYSNTYAATRSLPDTLCFDTAEVIQWSNDLRRCDEQMFFTVNELVDIKYQRDSIIGLRDACVVELKQSRKGKAKQTGLGILIGLVLGFVLGSGT
jgi:hypothetical protein